MIILTIIRLFPCFSQLEYKPPIHADEIGLTSDKYVALNDTVSWLPLQISYAPLSLQVHVSVNIDDFVFVRVSEYVGARMFACVCVCVCLYKFSTKTRPLTSF